MARGAGRSSFWCGIASSLRALKKRITFIVKHLESETLSRNSNAMIANYVSSMQAVHRLVEFEHALQQPRSCELGEDVRMGVADVQNLYLS